MLDFRYLEKGTGDVFVHAIAFVYSYQHHGPDDQVEQHTLKHGTLEWQTLEGNPKILTEAYEAGEMVAAGKSLRSVNFDEPTL